MKVSHVRVNRWSVVAVLVAAGCAAVVIAVASGTSGDGEAAEGSEPAAVEPIKGTDVKQVTLSADAARRLGIATARVSALGRGRTAIPAAAVLYAADGTTYTYTSPARLVFVRRPIAVARITRGRAILSKGPSAGSAVVTVGSQELFGTEYGVEED